MYWKNQGGLIHQGELDTVHYHGLRSYLFIIYFPLSLIIDKRTAKPQSFFQIGNSDSLLTLLSFGVLIFFKLHPNNPIIVRQNGVLTFSDKSDRRRTHAAKQVSKIEKKGNII